LRGSLRIEALPFVVIAIAALELAVAERLEIGKTSIILEEAEIDRSNWPVAVFCDDHFGQVLLL